MSDPASRWRAVALVAAVIGAGTAAYLLVEYTTGQPGLCLTGSGCDDVRASAFAYPLGVPMPLYGLAFYLAATWLAVRTLDPMPMAGIPPRTALLALALAGVAVSAVLTGLESFVIGAFCTWCLASAAASVILLVGAVGLWRTPPALPDEEGRSAKARVQRQRSAEAQRAGLRRTLFTSGSLTSLAVAGLLVAGALGQGSIGTPDDDGLAPATSPRLGTGAVTIVEFADFQCPACAVVGPMLAQLGAGNEATLVYRHFPLEAIHANANASARAASAAQPQDAFWEMADGLYRTQASWENLSAADADTFFASLAGELGLDVERWQADYASDTVRQAVATDAAAARDLNLPGTPTIFIGGELYEGERSLTAIRAAIAEAEATAS
jgi:protein-disulfide isomerase